MPHHNVIYMSDSHQRTHEQGIRLCVVSSLSLYMAPEMQELIGMRSTAGFSEVSTYYKG